MMKTVPHYTVITVINARASLQELTSNSERGLSIILLLYFIRLLNLLLTLTICIIFLIVTPLYSCVLIDK